MKPLLIAALILTAVACGSQEVDGPGTTRPAGPGTTLTTLPGATQQELLAEARFAWSSNRPDSYELTYVLHCECDAGPWYIRVEGSETVLSGRVGPEPGATVPYPSVETIFTSIQSALDTAAVPIDVEYDQDFGYPRSYIYDEPGLAYDAGFVLEVTAFAANPPSGDPTQRQEWADALGVWENAGLLDYDYRFTRGCFCPREFTGPYEASVRAGVVAMATFEGVDLFDIEMLEIGRYDELVLSVDGVFADIERALRDADSFRAEYHPELGYPTNVFIDWERNTADEEVAYTVEQLGPPTADPEA